MTQSSDDIIRLESAQRAIQEHFLGWQCRLRQHAMRHREGRPSTGMCPDIHLVGEGVAYPQVVVLILRAEAGQITAEWRHMVRRTKDPKERYEAALKFFSAGYYQDGRGFSDRLFALFGPGSATAERLRKAGTCDLCFDEKRQTYELPCRVSLLAPQDPFWQAAYWHNSLFNPNLPGEVEVLALQPDWSRAQADPPAF